MPKVIQDEFTHLAVSRQRRYQLRQEAMEHCRICGTKAVEGYPYCETHLDAQHRYNHDRKRKKKPVVTRVTRQRAEDMI